MKYTVENLNKIKEDYLLLNQKKRDEAQNKKEYLWSVLPEIKEIDSKLSNFGLSLLSLSQVVSPSDREEKINTLKENNVLLRNKRNEILEKNGFDINFDSVKYDCPICSDTGYDGINMCQCMKKKLIQANLESSGISMLSQEKTFDTYDLSLYNDTEAIHNNKLVSDYLRTYADSFSLSSKNILLVGGTGVGKTHLSVAVAKVLIEKNFSVIFESAENIIADFEYEKFHRGFYNQGDSKTDKYFACDLLIIDDLGAEAVTQFSRACVYNLINTRINSRLPMLVSTNLVGKKIVETYEDRIASRLFGEFNPLILSGHDLRNRVKK